MNLFRSQNDPLKPLHTLLKDFVSKSKRNHPGWKIEFSRDDLTLTFACKRACCKGLREMDEIPRHGLDVSFRSLLYSLSDREGGVDFMISGLSYDTPDDIGPPSFFLPRGYTIDDAVAVAREALDMVPVCLRILEADNIHWIKRLEMRDYG